MPLYAGIRAEALAQDAPALGPFLFKTVSWLLGLIEVVAGLGQRYEALPGRSAV